MKVSENEILFIYDSSDIHQREALVYAKSLQHHNLKSLDITRDRLTQLLLSNLAKKLNVSVKDLMRTDNESSFSEVMNLDNPDFLDYLASNLHMLNTPIAVYHNHAKFIDSQYELIKEDGVNNLHRPNSSKI